MNMNQYLSDMVDMGETYDDGPSEVISKETEKKPHYPDIYGLNISELPAVQDTKVGEDVIIVIRAKVKSLEVRDTEKNGKKSTACLEIHGAAAYPMTKSPEMKTQNKMAEDEDMPQKGNQNYLEDIIGSQASEEED